MIEAASPRHDASATDRIEAWFDARGWSILDFQRHTWAAYARGESGLVHAPTGTGKTLAIGFAALADWRDNVADPDARPPLTLRWVTPLRAGRVPERSLAASAAELGLNWRVGRRSGDTPSHAKTRQRKQMPSAACRGAVFMRARARG